MQDDETSAALEMSASRAGSGMTLKAFLAMAAALAIAIGLALPAPHRRPPPTHSQFLTIELGPS